MRVFITRATVNAAGITQSTKRASRPETLLRQLAGV
jgi:hypothetical protein